MGREGSENGFAGIAPRRLPLRTLGPCPPAGRSAVLGGSLMAGLHTRSLRTARLRGEAIPRFSLIWQGMGAECLSWDIRGHFRSRGRIVSVEEAGKEGVDRRDATRGYEKWVSVGAFLISGNSCLTPREAAPMGEIGSSARRSSGTSWLMVAVAVGLCVVWLEERLPYEKADD